MSWSLAKAVAPSLFTALLALDGRAPWAVLIATSAVAAALLIRTEPRLPAEAVRPLPATVARGGAPGAPAPAPAPAPGRAPATALASASADAALVDAALADAALADAALADAEGTRRTRS
jgi:hypothetical protein